VSSFSLYLSDDLDTRVSRDVGTATHIWSMFPAGRSILCAMWFIFKYTIPEIRHDERSSRRPEQIVKGNVNIQRGYENKARSIRYKYNRVKL